MKPKPRRGILIVGIGAAMVGVDVLLMRRREEAATATDRMMIVETPARVGKTEGMLEQVVLEAAGTVKIDPLLPVVPFVSKRRMPEWKEPPRHWNGR